MSEFCLSDTINQDMRLRGIVAIEDVKEFIKLRNDINLEIVKWGNQWAEYVNKYINKEDVLEFWNKGISGAKEIKEKIDKLAGEGLR